MSEFTSDDDNWSVGNGANGPNGGNGGNGRTSDSDSDSDRWGLGLRMVANLYPRVYFAWEGPPTTVLSQDRVEEVFRILDQTPPGSMPWAQHPIPDFLDGRNPSPRPRYPVCVIYWSLLGNNVLPEHLETILWHRLHNYERSGNNQVYEHDPVCQPCLEAGNGSCGNHVESHNGHVKGGCFRCAAYNIDCPKANQLIRLW